MPPFPTATPSPARADTPLCRGARRSSTAGMIARCSNPTTSGNRWCGKCAYPPWALPAPVSVTPGAAGPAVAALLTSPTGRAVAPLDAAALSVRSHAAERFVLRFGGTLADADALIRSQLAPLTGRVSPLYQDADENGNTRLRRRYQVGDLVFVMDAANSTLVTVLPAQHAPLGAGDVIPGVDPHTTNMTKSALTAFAKAAGVPAHRAEEGLRAALTQVKGRVSPPTFDPRGSTRRYKVTVPDPSNDDGTRELTLFVAADNRAVLTVRPSRPRTTQTVPPVLNPAGRAALLARLDTDPPEVSRAAVTAFLGRHTSACGGAQQVADEVRVVLEQALAGKDVKPNRAGGGYVARYGTASVFLSSDLAMVTGYANGKTATPTQYRQDAPRREAERLVRLAERAQRRAQQRLEQWDAQQVS